MVLHGISAALRHPHEDLMDALRGGVRDLGPNGRRPKPKFEQAVLGILLIAGHQNLQCLLTLCIWYSRMHNNSVLIGDFKMAKHARTTISVPSALKVRMDAVDETVNWSAVACQAFELKLAEIIKRKGAKNVKEAIKRLKASKRKTDDARYREGSEAGKAWAMNEAEAEELQNLDSFREGCEREGGWEEWFTTPKWNAAFSNAEHIAFVAVGVIDGEWDRIEAQDFLFRAVGEKEIDDRFLRGFVDGALEIWEEVKKEV